MELQKKAEALFEAHEGSIVVLDPSDGAILAMVSKPSFDPNIFAGGIDAKNWKSLMQDPLKPLENRAIRGQYPPGSIFKIVMGFAILNEKIVRADEKIHCHGSFPFGKRVFQDWKKGGAWTDRLRPIPGPELRRLLLHQRPQAGHQENRAFTRACSGLGAPTGFGAAEKGGLVPSDAWKRRRFQERWYQGETISVSIGQGFNLITPMQAANLIATVANGGYLWKPYLVKKVLNPGGKTLFESKPRLIRKIPISEKIFPESSRRAQRSCPRRKGHCEKSPGEKHLRSRQDGHRSDSRPQIHGPQKKARRTAAKIPGPQLVRPRSPPTKNPTIAIAIFGRKRRQAGVFFRPVRQRADFLPSREKQATNIGLE